MDIVEALQDLEAKYDFIFKEKQKLAITSIFNCQDTFVVLPTGYGKSKIYSHLPELYELVTHAKGTVLVISPIQALMIDQVTKLENNGVSATFLGEKQTDKSIPARIIEGEFSIVFSSPEAVLNKGPWRRCITQGVFHDHLKAVVIDEAHCITQWGGEFRKEYSHLGELRSVVPKKTTFVTLTATATRSIKKDIMKTLDMDIKTSIISVIPERPNLSYYVQKSSKNLADLDWLINDLLKFEKSTKKTIIYCRNIVSCSNLYEYFRLSLNDRSESLDNRLIGMFHRSTADINKSHVLDEFQKLDSSLRVVFATIAFGMGIDIPDIERVIHWGGPRGLEQFSQESGRAGRDGRSAVSIIYFSGYDLAKGNCSEEVREFCKTEDCLRNTLCAYFQLDTSGYSVIKPDPPCTCCSNCKLKCVCGFCSESQFLGRELDNSSVLDEDFNTGIKRDLTLEQRRLLRENLLDYKECLIEEESELSCELEDFALDHIVKNAPYLLCEDDVISLGLVSPELAADILTLIEEV
ncbi:ATP-dependent DNA helicase RecQ-like [Mytilus galloprovincialis]|uniref:ATP-dependent DNA helicase RecQ-like n=1 Tax=Mytilus galloprovincialis TaxID=29158 RepID=UPI003F7C7459